MRETTISSPCFASSNGRPHGSVTYSGISGLQLHHRPEEVLGLRGSEDDLGVRVQSEGQRRVHHELRLDVLQVLVVGRRREAQGGRARLVAHEREHLHLVQQLVAHVEVQVRVSGCGGFWGC
jgi:hypothetical protein